MFEKQRKLEEERSKTPMSKSDEPSHSPTKTSAAIANNEEKSEILEKDKDSKGSGSNDSSASPKPPEENPSKEQKPSERKVCNDNDEDSIVPPAKRTKADDSSTSS